jgi:lipopolysaccharide export system permease protein
MMPAALIIAGGGMLATLMMTVHGMPQGKLAIRQLTYATLAAHANVGLKARTFNDRIDKVTLYVNAIETQTMRLTDVFIEDRRDPAAVNTIVAPDGQLIRVPERRAIRLRLYNGLINQVKRGSHSASSLYFSTYDIEFDLKQAAKLASDREKDEDEMTLTELKAYIIRARGYPDAYRDALVAYHAKFSIPAACLALGILAIPLGVELKSRRKSAGLGMGLIVFVAYYLMMTAGRVTGEMGLVHPLLGLWVPNVFFGIIGVVMLVRSANEKPLYWMDGLRALGWAMVRSIARLMRRRAQRVG